MKPEEKARQEIDQLLEKAMKGKGISWPRFKKGELADLLEFIRTPKKTERK
jgi:hypothetical protein